MENIKRAKEYAKDYKWKFEDATPEGFFIVSCINTQSAYNEKFKESKLKYRYFQGMICLNDGDCVALGDMGKGDTKSRMVLTAPTIEILRDRARKCNLYS